MGFQSKRRVKMSHHEKDQHTPKAPCKENDKTKGSCTDKDKTPAKEQPKVHASGPDQHKK
jgi:hypothetical protein